MGRVMTAAFGGAFACIVACGCVPPETSVDSARLLKNFDENADKLPYFKAEGTLTVKAYADGWFRVFKRSEDFTVLLAKDPENPAGPCDFALYVLDLGEPVMGMGSSTVDGMYYMFIGFGQSGMCNVGRTALAGAPGIEGMSLDISAAAGSDKSPGKGKKLDINPLQLVSAFAVIPPSNDLTSMPGAILQMQGDHWPFEYILTCIDRQGSTQRIVPLHRMIFDWKKDVEPRLPRRIEYLDPNGVWVMTAKIRKYKPVDVADFPNPPQDPPVMPSEIIYTWRNARSGKKMITLTLELSDVWAPEIDYSEACRLIHRIPKGLLNKARLIDAHLDAPKSNNPKNNPELSQ